MYDMRDFFSKFQTQWQLLKSSTSPARQARPRSRQQHQSKVLSRRKDKRKAKKTALEPEMIQDVHPFVNTNIEHSKYKIIVNPAKTKRYI